MRLRFEGIKIDNKYFTLDRGTELATRLYQKEVEDINHLSREELVDIAKRYVDLQEVVRLHNSKIAENLIKVDNL